jgi:hypothetical protein
MSNENVIKASIISIEVLLNAGVSPAQLSIYQRALNYLKSIVTT